MALNESIEGGYARQYAQVSALGHPGGLSRQTSKSSYAQIVKATNDRIKKQKERARQIEQEEEQQKLMAQLRRVAEKQAAKISRVPPHPSRKQQNTPSADPKAVPSISFLDMLRNIRQEASGGAPQDGAFIDSCAPFLESNVHGTKTFVREEIHSRSETHQLAISSVQSKLPPAKINATTSDRHGARKHVSSFTQGNVDTSVSNTISSSVAKPAAITVPPEDEYLNSMDACNTASLQKLISDVRQLPTCVDSSDSESSYDDAQPISKKMNPTIQPRAHLVASATLAISPPLISSSPHDTTGISQLSPIVHSRKPEITSKFVPTQKKFNGLETITLNRELHKFNTEEEFLQSELLALDKKLASYSIDSANTSQHAGMSVSILSELQTKQPLKTLEDLARSSPDDDLTDEQRRQKYLDYLKHQQLHDSKTVKESLSNAAVGIYQFKLQHTEQLRANPQDYKHASANNKVQYSALAPVSSSTSNSCDKISMAKSSNKGQASGPMKRVMRRTSAKSSNAEPKSLPPVLTGSNSDSQTTTTNYSLNSLQEQPEQHLCVQNPHLLNTLFSKQLDSSQNVEYGILNVIKARQNSESRKHPAPPQKIVDHSFEDNDDIDDNEIHIALACYSNDKGNRKETPFSRPLSHTTSSPYNLGSHEQNDRRGQRKNLHVKLQRNEENNTSDTISESVKSIVHVRSDALRPGSKDSRSASLTEEAPAHPTENKVSIHKLTRQTSQSMPLKERPRSKSVTFDDHSEEIKGNIIEPKYMHNPPRPCSSKEEIEELNNEFLPFADNLTVSDLLDNDDDALDDYDFAAY